MPRKRRSFSATFKSKVALDAIKGLKTVAEIAKLHQVHTSQVVLWKRQLLEGVESVFDGPTDRKDKAADQPQTAELYEQIGKLNMQLEWLKKKNGRELSLRNVSGSIGNTRSLAFVSSVGCSV